MLAFEEAALEEAGIAFAPVPPRYRTTYFSHIWSSGYSAGYYSYIWSEVLDADSVEWFKENDGLTRAKTATTSARPCYRRAAASRPWTSSAPSAAGTPRWNPYSAAAA